MKAVICLSLTFPDATVHASSAASLQFWVRKYEREARKNWDVFYKNNQDRFFKDRHYLAREFPHVFPDGLAPTLHPSDGSGGGRGGTDDDDDRPTDRGEGKDDRKVTDGSEPGIGRTPTKCDGLNVVHVPNEEEHELGPAPRYERHPDDVAAGRPRVFLEVGCGVGNTAFPLLGVDQTAEVYCCDFSPRAVELVRKRREALPTEQRRRIHPFVCDITCEPLVENVPPASVDVCTMVFVLSAISPEKMATAIRNVSSVMRPGARGRVLVRDYAAGDLALERFAARDGQRLSENFYVRGDGTRAYFFTSKHLSSLFADQGMVLEELAIHERVITNRGKGVNMERRWVQASYASAMTPGAPLPPPPAPEEPEWMRRKRALEAREREKAEEAEKAAAEERAREEVAARERSEAAAAVGACGRGTLEAFVLQLLKEERVTSGEVLTGLNINR